MIWWWGEYKQSAFDTLKWRLCSPPVLLLPNLTKPLNIDADTGNNAIGAGLLQYGNDGNLHPVAYMSHKYLP